MTKLYAIRFGLRKLARTAGVKACAVRALGKLPHKNSVILSEGSREIHVFLNGCAEPESKDLLSFTK